MAKLKSSLGKPPAIATQQGKMVRSVFRITQAEKKPAHAGYLICKQEPGEDLNRNDMTPKNENSYYFTFT